MRKDLLFTKFKILTGVIVTSVVIFSLPTSILAREPGEELAEEMLKMFAGMIPDVKETITLEKGMQGTAQIKTIVDPNFEELWGQGTTYPDELNPQRGKIIKDKKLYIIETVSFSDLSELSEDSRKFSYTSEKKWFSRKYHISIALGAIQADTEQKKQEPEPEIFPMLKMLAGEHFYEFEIITAGKIEEAKPVQIEDLKIQPTVEKQKAIWAIPFNVFIERDTSKLILKFELTILG